MTNVKVFSFTLCIFYIKLNLRMPYIFEHFTLVQCDRVTGSMQPVEMKMSVDVTTLAYKSEHKMC